MLTILKDLVPSRCLVYQDSVIVFVNDYLNLLKNLEAVREHVREAGLTLNPMKCELSKSRLTPLGHAVSAEGNSTNPHKVRKVREWPTAQASWA